METITLDQIKEYCKENNRICPQPKSWDLMWKRLARKRRSGIPPPIPLILAAWWEAPGILKVIRLMEQLDWADKNGLLSDISVYLHSLPEEQWYHLGE